MRVGEVKVEVVVLFSIFFACRRKKTLYRKRRSEADSIFGSDVEKKKWASDLFFRWVWVRAASIVGLKKSRGNALSDMGELWSLGPILNLKSKLE